MPRVTISTMEAKSLEQKRALVEGFVDVCVRVLHVPKERVNVAIEVYDPENLATGGELVCDKLARQASEAGK